MAKKTGLSRIITILVLLAAAAGILYAVVSFNKQEVVEMKKGVAAPDFTLETLDGKSVTLSDLKGKVVLLNVWATWCAPCREEMPAIQQAYDAYKDAGLEVLGVNLRENNITVKGFANEFKLTFPILLDKEAKVGVDLYKVVPIPTSFFIDKDGVLREIASFPMSYEYIENTVKPLLQAQ